MTIIRTPITDEASWLAARRPNINASEVAALFGCHAQETMLSLHARKAGVDLPGPTGEILERGHILEPAVAEFVRRQRPAWKIAKNEDYLHSPHWRLGATPDYWVHCPERGIGVLQCKAVAMPQYREKWQDGPPMGFILQTAQEVLLAGESMRQAVASPAVGWGAIGVLAVGNYDHDGAVFEFERNSGAEARIIRAATSFWDDIANGRQPKPDFAKDQDVIRALYPRDNGQAVDLTGDNRLAFLLEERERLLAEIKTAAPAEKEVEAINAEIRAKLGDAAIATIPGWEITHKTQKRKAVPECEFRVLRVKRVQAREMAA
jgi:predicted phage-related endonuclease